LGGEPSGGILVIPNTGLVAPVDFGLFLFDSGLNLWIDRLTPLLHRFGILLISPFHRFLRGESPTLQIVGDGPQRQIAPIMVFNSQAKPRGSTGQKTISTGSAISARWVPGLRASRPPRSYFFHNVLTWDLPIRRFRKWFGCPADNATFGVNLDGCEITENA